MEDRYLVVKTDHKDFKQIWILVRSFCNIGDFK